MYANFHLKLCKFDLWRKNWTKTIFLAKTDILANLAKCEKSFWMYILFFSERSLSYSSITTEVLRKIIASVFAYEGGLAPKTEFEPSKLLTGQLWIRANI